MKKIFTLVLAFSSTVLLASTIKEQVPNKSDKTVYIKASNIKKETIPVAGMTCLGCEVTLEKGISKIKGVAKAKASSTNDNVVVEYDSTKTNKSAIVNAIKKAGYEAQE
jgi:copper chaperone CopZ